MNSTTLAYLPSPSTAGLQIGPLPVRFYALCIIAGIAIAVILGERRWRAKGGEPHIITDIAIWAVPFGLIGGRLYHVVTDPELYFEHGEDWVRVFYVWDGGLGIWGAIALGGLGAWIGARRRGVRMPAYADAVAPGIVLAQAMGRWGNWFNNELYGDPTSKPWGLTIHCMSQDGIRQAVACPGSTSTVLGHFQPTFLYEVIWDVLVCVLLLWADRRFSIGHGRLFALYVMGYTAGRGWIEHLRSDYAHAFLGLRVNDWASIVCFSAALAYFLISRRLRPGKESREELYWPYFKPYAPEGGARADDREDEGEAASEDVSSGGRRPENDADRDPQERALSAESAEDDDAEAVDGAKHEEHA
ncbi:prolipoprotein diacylglyceryl transferase [Actinospica robiniae]|uniref:prolipoprotein diacylglyceryl transferase n=1 Tax=Actinospica robiniae TaxID=304901 RepID=UPI0004237EF4|nr:prolipoprotein diacylglyceryl transferase [Actinospica robiniae]